jgi:hypothetical protein
MYSRTAWVRVMLRCEPGRASPEAQNGKMKARVFVTLKNGVLDPQGKAIGNALHGLGFGRSARCARAR